MKKVLLYGFLLTAGLITSVTVGTSEAIASPQMVVLENSAGGDYHTVVLGSEEFVTLIKAGYRISKTMVIIDPIK